VQNVRRQRQEKEAKECSMKAVCEGGHGINTGLECHVSFLEAMACWWRYGRWCHKYVMSSHPRFAGGAKRHAGEGQGKVGASYQVYDP